MRIKNDITLHINYTYDPYFGCIGRTIMDSYDEKCIEEESCSEPTKGKYYNYSEVIERRQVETDITEKFTKLKIIRNKIQASEGSAINSFYIIFSEDIMKDADSIKIFINGKEILTDYDVTWLKREYWVELDLYDFSILERFAIVNGDIYSLNIKSARKKHNKKNADEIEIDEIDMY